MILLKEQSISLRKENNKCVKGINTCSAAYPGVTRWLYV
jgi:hypothetical protein